MRRYNIVVNLQPRYTSNMDVACFKSQFDKNRVRHKRTLGDAFGRKRIFRACRDYWVKERPILVS